MNRFIEKQLDVENDGEIHSVKPLLFETAVVLLKRGGVLKTLIV